MKKGKDGAHMSVYVFVRCVSTPGDEVLSTCHILSPHSSADHVQDLSSGL